MLTIFTPTYNRGSTLKRLFSSLLSQTVFDFEWVVIDDGSNDNTSQLFDVWTNGRLPFSVVYKKRKNGGKLRALNDGMWMARGKFFLILDSDDMLCPNAVETILKAFENMPVSDDSFIGISFVRGDVNGKPLHGYPVVDPVKGYVDCDNLERHKYNLMADMAEVFYTEKLRKYSFPVWSGEKFTPEEVVWNQMALDGYKLRWYNKVIYLCEYQPDGLTNSSWILMRDNPMGYAMMFNHRLLYSNGFLEKVKNVIYFLSLCFMSGNIKYVCQCNEKLIAYCFLPLGMILAYRRKRQIKRFCE